jgi:hypothetical protein
MPSILSVADPKTEAAEERQYRRGYNHGVNAVLAAVAPYLPEKPRLMLDIWSTNELLPWSVDSELFIPPRAPALNIDDAAFNKWCRERTAPGFDHRQHYDPAFP